MLYLLLTVDISFLISLKKEQNLKKIAIEKNVVF